MHSPRLAFGLLLIGAAVLVGASHSASSYRLPLDVPPVLVASFAEYRPDHLHPGVDLSTSGATGLPVFAVAEGEIYRLKVEWRGYGRAVYVRHRDGRISVYAHLERFEEAKLGLESRVAEARRTGHARYPGDIYLDPPVKVKGGQLIAFSGESGAGLPHLHFEMRDGEQHPADPSFILRGLAPAPPPRPEALVLLAEKAGTLVQGSLSAEIPLKRDNNRYVPSRAIVVTGSFVPEVRVVAEDSSGHRLGIPGLSARLDGKLVYRAFVKEFSFDQYPQVGLLLDHSRSRLSPSEFTYRLKRLPGNTLGLPSNPPETPWPSLSPGRHQLDIQMAGPQHSLIEASIPFEMVAPPRPAWKEASRLASGSYRLSLDFGAPAGHLSNLQVVYSAFGSSTPLACESRQSFAGGETCSFSGLERSRGISATLLANGVPVARSTHMLPSAVKEASLPPLRVVPGIDYVDVEALPSRPDGRAPSRLVLQGKDGESLEEFSEIAAGVVAASIPIERWASTTRIETEWDDQDPSERRKVDLTPRVARPSETLRLEDCGLSVDFPAGAFFAATPLACEPYEEDLPETKGLSLHGPIVRLLPSGTPLARKATITFPRPEGVPPQRLAIYRFDFQGKEWIYLGGETSASGVSTTVGRLDTFALLEDHSTPEILGMEPPSTAVLSRTPRFVVRVRDSGSGLSYDGLHLAVDGVELEMEFDPDREWSVGTVNAPLSPGSHILSAWAEDRSGNRTPAADSTVQVR